METYIEKTLEDHIAGASVTPTKKKSVYLFVKRTIDILGAGMGLIVLSPIFLVVALLIKLEDGGPVIHTRMCVGNRNHTYKMYKFRTMVPNADDFQKHFTPEQLEMYLQECKLDNDPRITKVGNVLRKTSIDELPQLLSVLKGDMSLVGPRPVVEREALAYGNTVEVLLSVRPGITGWWQVNSRSNIGFLSDESRALQLYYAENCSMKLDIQILIKTIGAVIGGRGAK